MTPGPSDVRRRGTLPRLIVVVVLLLFGVVAYQATRTVLALRDAEQSASRLQTQVADSDVAGARASADDVASSARTAREHSDGWLWRGLTALPWAGDDLAAVRDVSAALDEVGGALPSGLDLVEEARGGALRTPQGGVDLEVLRGLGPDVDRLADATAEASRTVADIDTSRLVGRLEAPTASFLERLDGLRATAAGAATAVEVLPGILGGDGARDYLLVAQNNAEIRATGGLPGSASVISARDGSIDLGFQGSAGDVMGDGSPVADFLPGEREVFGRLLLTDFRDTNFTPDFPRAASLMAAFADRSRAERVDGVVSVDPVLLAQVLRATGSVTIAGEEVDADNAVRQLLLEPYLRLQDGGQQDAYFQLAARDILAALLDEGGDQATLLRTLGEGVSQRRLLFWSADPPEQDTISSSAVAGALPSDTGRPEVGLYLNDGTQAKMQYFLRSEAGIVSEGCDVDGRQVMRVRLRLTNDVTLPVSALTDFVTGNGSQAPRGDSRMQLRIFAPEGGELIGLEIDGERADVGQAEVYGRQVTQARVQLAPGESTEVVAQLTGRAGERGDPRVQWTPGIEWGPTQEVATSRC